ncbi:MAG: hypothetical protein IPK50_06525 [Fibrobacterota bacterium]|nr:MAG: hypothetical protein IPK50_06525 [Fibrobacterota bacterium]
MSATMRSYGKAILSSLLLISIGGLVPSCSDPVGGNGAASEDTVVSRLGNVRVLDAKRVEDGLMAKLDLPKGRQCDVQITTETRQTNGVAMVVIGTDTLPPPASNEIRFCRPAPDIHWRFFPLDDSGTLAVRSLQPGQFILPALSRTPRTIQSFQGVRIRTFGGWGGDDTVIVSATGKLSRHPSGPITTPSEFPLDPATMDSLKRLLADPNLLDAQTVPWESNCSDMVGWEASLKFDDREIHLEKPDWDCSTPLPPAYRQAERIVKLLQDATR